MRPEDHRPQPQQPRPVMGDVLPPVRPAGTPPTTTPQQPLSAPPHIPGRTEVPPIADSRPAVLPDLAPTPESEKPPKAPRRKRWLWVVGILCVVLALLAGGLVAGKLWYDEQLKPVNTANSDRVRVTIESGMTPDQIASLLKQKGIIRSDLVFVWYTKEQGIHAKLRAGTYNLAPSESLAQIADHLAAGKTDEFSVTFLPGDTLANNRERLLKVGYTAAEVDAALQKTYDHPALASKPSEADLEGYLYGETYSFTGDAMPEHIVTRTLDELQEQIVKYDLVNAYKKQGLTLFEGITLASIVQREVSGEADEKQVAQVFYKRLKDDISLGSDVTYIYAAKKMGVPATPDLKSPYNTRIYKGLPPGPISAPGLSALLAVASPASGDYNYFLAGDDGKTYFAHTYAQHEDNIVKHCQKGCQ